MEQRGMKILAAIIDEYIRTGEPVDTKTLAEMPGIGVSSATIRNTMAALEQEGYLDTRIRPPAEFRRLRASDTISTTLCAPNR